MWYLKEIRTRAFLLSACKYPFQILHREEWRWVETASFGVHYKDGPHVRFEFDNQIPGPSLDPNTEIDAKVFEEDLQRIPRY